MILRFKTNLDMLPSDKEAIARLSDSFHSDHPPCIGSRILLSTFTKTNLHVVSIQYTQRNLAIKGDPTVCIVELSCAPYTSISRFDAAYSARINK